MSTNARYMSLRGNFHIRQPYDRWKSLAMGGAERSDMARSRSLKTGAICVFIPLAAFVMVAYFLGILHWPINWEARVARGDSCPHGVA